MKKILTLILCFALICSLSVSAFAAGTPEPLYSNDSLLFRDYGSDSSMVVDGYVSISLPPIDNKLLYFLIDDSFYAFSPILVEDSGVTNIAYGDVSFFEGFPCMSMAFLYSPSTSEAIFVLSCPDCPDPSTPHPHSIAIYDEYPFASSAPASDAPAFIAATGDGFKLMNSITAGIMGNPVLLFLLAASLIPVGIALFKALKNAASRK